MLQILPKTQNLVPCVDPTETINLSRSVKMKTIQFYQTICVKTKPGNPGTPKPIILRMDAWISKK